MPIRLAAGLLACLCALAAPPTHHAARAAPDEGAVRRAAEQAQLDAMIAELRPVVARMRGLEWKRDVVAKLVSRAELRTLLEAQLAEDVTPEEMDRDNRILRRLGLLRADEDLMALQLLMLQEMVAGAYDPKSKLLYVIEGFVGDAQKPTIVHELVHALDDQHYDLLALEEPYRDADPDRQFAIRCLFEGSAEYARRVYQDAHPDVAATFYAQLGNNPEAAAGQMRVLQTVPTYMLLPSLLHYRAGPDFVGQALGHDYAGGMQRLFADPPTTQEQILHPYKWLGPQRDLPRTVRWGADVAGAAGAGWKRLDEHSVGELDFAVFLDFFLGDLGGRLNTDTMGEGKFVSRRANRGARGWDAGRALYLEGPEEALIVVQAYAFDSVADAQEAATLLAVALQSAHGDAWKGRGWTADASDASVRAYDYDGRHGAGRIFQRGNELLVLDGAPAALFAPLWACLELTRFEQDPRDEGDEAADPFAGCEVVDAHRGLGLRVPDTTWHAEAVHDSVFSFARASQGELRVDFLVIDQEVTQAGLPDMARVVLGAQFDPQRAEPVAVMGTQGLRHPLPGQRGHVHVASDAARTYVVLVLGPEATRATSADDIALLLGGVRVPRRGEAAGSAPRSAGLRSVPGY